MKLFWIIIIFCIASTCVVAQESNNLNICYEEWRPFAFTENKVIKGETIAKLQGASGSLGITFNFYELPFKRCLTLVKKGLIDFALFVDNKDGLTLFNHAIAYWNITAVTAEKLSFYDIKEIQAFQNSRIIIAQDYEYPKEFTEFIATLNSHIMPVSYYVTNPREDVALFSLLINDRADIMFVDSSWAHQIKSKYKLPLNISPFIIHGSPQYIGYGNTSNEKIEVMRSLLHIL
ncbi:transporter substrate-binding domain-containing protein [Litorilituus lipolyticus]|uniref:Transporter substrate-binding domain-containing protein n=1 Tax=Litorilituus lipolyticus TaxID=2491017 RepID=A0A502L1Z8_9GAMM|nr:transporter substrate-binding domain-containing protein [Litorilituus lipolyticus]TPH17686.1 transporter substrate-binding domain-containing protein [Litorilituus lipolyticus]